MNARSRIDQLTDDIAANRVPGGSAFARAAAELIALRVAEHPEAESLESVRQEIVAVSQWVATTKPSMAVVRNVAELAQSLASEAAYSDAGALRAGLAAAMAGYIRRSEDAIEALGAQATSLFRNDCTVLVHSYSASLETLLRAAVGADVRFRLLVTESRPYRESRRLMEAVAGSETDIVLYSDAAVSIAAAEADFALVGADTVFRDGSFANKTGSMPLALACRFHDVPLYVATELAKVYFGDIDDIEMELRPAGEMSEQWPLIESGRIRVWNQFFEHVPADLIHRYLTEVGLLEPLAMRAAAASSWPKQVEDVSLSASRNLVRDSAR